MVFVHEVFRSIQGEGSLAGHPHVFVRLSGCNLRCRYCDTVEAQEKGGTEESVIELADRVLHMGVKYVLVTGGEPLWQKDGRVLIDALAERGLIVTVETNGSISVEGVNPKARILMDVKTPGSGEETSTDLANLVRLKPADEIKFVLVGRKDYDWATRFCEERGLFGGPRTIHFSPAADTLAARDLADWIVADRIPVRLNLQLHKILWPGESGR